jgi:hypothetical protein
MLIVGTTAMILADEKNSQQVQGSAQRNERASER